MHVNIKSSQQAKNLDNEFDWEKGFLNKKINKFYRTILSYGL
jgi:hypothetical protein